MAGSLNKVMLIGNVGRDPQIRQTNNGQRLCNLAIATSDQWTDKSSGEKRERTEWHRVVIFDDRLVEVCEKFVKKGSKLYIEGALQTRKWQDQSGQDRYTTEVVLQRFRGELQMLDRPQQQGGYSDHQARLGNEGSAPGPDESDEPPF